MVLTEEEKRSYWENHEYNNATGQWEPKAKFVRYLIERDRKGEY